ncbi:hypothetical protein B9Z55_006646 [Caenorhabditis nigoni]|uniref:Serpentine receptor class gamma n=3 Tax=Caenorhabditis nigoni TaxID=1611254 RepID=A0A2G5V654_9PELO|nr:hypothetical protein B9Z55_006646 [Caenorhabditis nigoni]
MKLHYAISMSNVLCVIAVERSLASYFLNDYEKKSRFWIPITIVLVDQSFNFIVSYFFYLNYVPFFYMIIITGTPNAMAICLMIHSQNYNRKVTKTHEKYTSNYSLAARFQAKENLKCFRMIKKILIAAFSIVVFGFFVAIALFLNIFPQMDTLWNLCLLAVTSLPPLVICPAIIYSVDSFRNYPFLDCFFIKLKVAKVTSVPRKRSSARSEDIQRETETYFNQLAASWT